MAPATALFACGCGLFPDLDHLTGAVAPGAPVCELVAEPSYLKAGEPRADAALGGVLAGTPDMLVAVATGEDPAVAPIPETVDFQDACVFRPAPNLPGTGRVRVFERAGPAWSEQELSLADGHLQTPYLPQAVLPDFYSHAKFSTYTLAASEGLVVVGTASDPNGGIFRGSVRVFRRRADGYHEDAERIVQPMPQDGDVFGMRIALSGRTLVVGAPGEDGAAQDSGAAYVYELNDTGHERLSRLSAGAEQQENAWFGSSVALTDDWIVVSAARETVENGPFGSQNEGGAVYVFSRHGGQSERLLPEDSIGDQNFGTSVAVAGDTIAVGSPAARGCIHGFDSELRGVVHVYKLKSGTWTHTQCLDANDEYAVLFGWRLALDAGGLVVAAPFSNGRGRGENPSIVRDSLYESTGSVYLFPALDDGFVQSCHLKAPNADPCDGFGEAVVASDGYIAVGSIQEDGRAGGMGPFDTDNQLRDSGAIYLYPRR